MNDTSVNLWASWGEGTCFMPLKTFPSHLHMTGNMFVGNSYPVPCSTVVPAQGFSNISLCIHSFNNSLLSNYYGGQILLQALRIRWEQDRQASVPRELSFASGR